MTYAGTLHTVEFVTAHVPPGGRLVEVGCGDGRVARALQDLGFDVLAVDSDAESVAGARANGVDAVHVDFLDLQETGFDVVLFSRSLHHIHDLSRAVEHATALCTPQARVVVEDFSIEAPDVETLTWFYGLVSFAAAAGLLSDAPREMPHDVEAAWQKEHEGHGDIATRQQMLQVLGERLALLHEETVPYLYRYFRRLTLPGAESNRAIEAVKTWESRLIADGGLRACGWRTVWAARPSR